MFAKASNMLTPFILRDIQQGHHCIPAFDTERVPLHFPYIFPDSRVV